MECSGPVSGDVFRLSYFQCSWMEAVCGFSGSRPLEGSDSSDSYAKVFADVAARLPAECISSAALARGDAQDSDDEDPDQPVKKKRRCGHPSRVIEAMLRKGDELREQGRFRDALKVCETMLSQNPNDEQIHLLKSECYLALKDRRSAFEATKKVVECNPKHCKCINWSIEQLIDCSFTWLIDWLFDRLIDWLIDSCLFSFVSSLEDFRLFLCSKGMERLAWTSQQTLWWNQGISGRRPRPIPSSGGPSRRGRQRQSGISATPYWTVGEFLTCLGIVWTIFLPVYRNKNGITAGNFKRKKCHVFFDGNSFCFGLRSKILL